MKRTSELFFGIATLFLMGFVLWHMLYVTNLKPTIIPIDTKPTEVENVISKQTEFRTQLESIVINKGGHPVEGFEPMMFALALPGLELQDFDQVAAMIGHYEYVNGELRYNIEGAPLLHSAAGAITEEGMNTLLNNISERLQINLEVTPVEQIINLLEVKKPTVKPAPVSTTTSSVPMPDKPRPVEPVACTMDAKICPDGSYVGRTAPNCEFAACPAANPETKTAIKCSPESKQAEVCTMIYAPVCASVEVQCITTPCNPVPQTFGNSCSACAQANVTSYTEGECGGVQMEM